MRLLLLAGEESGVLYANGIAERARKVIPDLEIRGYGDYGFETHDLAVMGLWAVLRRIFYFLNVKKTMERAIDEWKPDVVCTVDYPGLNMKLAAYAKAKGIRSVHVVCPQVWAWKASRIPRVEASLGHLCCFFPFEPKLFKPGFAEYIGHPLAAEMSEKGEGTGDEGRGTRLLAVLPGSRRVEIERHMPVLMEVIRGLREKYPDIEVVIPAATDRAYAAIAAFLPPPSPSPLHPSPSTLHPSPSTLHPSPSTLHPSPFTLVRGGARELLRRADCAVVASGTATLEAALAHCPTVLVYQVNFFFATFLRHAFKGMIRHVGLANIIWEKCVSAEAAAGDLAEAPMPELLQENFTAPAVRAWLDRWLASPESRAEARRRLDATMAFLAGTGDPLGRVVEIIRT